MEGLFEADVVPYLNFNLMILTLLGLRGITIRLVCNRFKTCSLGSYA